VNFFFFGDGLITEMSGICHGNERWLETAAWCRGIIQM
jgi:hypothetical protein